MGLVACPMAQRIKTVNRQPGVVSLSTQLTAASLQRAGLTRARVCRSPPVEVQAQAHQCCLEHTAQVQQAPKRPPKVHPTRSACVGVCSGPEVMNWPRPKTPLSELPQVYSSPGMVGIGEGTHRRPPNPMIKTPSPLLVRAKVSRAEV